MKKKILVLFLLVFILCQFNVYADNRNDSSNVEYQSDEYYDIGIDIPYDQFKKDFNEILQSYFNIDKQYQLDKCINLETDGLCKADLIKDVVTILFFENDNGNVCNLTLYADKTYDDLDFLAQISAAAVDASTDDKDVNAGVASIKIRAGMINNNYYKSYEHVFGKIYYSYDKYPDKTTMLVGVN